MHQDRQSFVRTQTAAHQLAARRLVAGTKKRSGRILSMSRRSPPGPFSLVKRERIRVGALSLSCARSIVAAHGALARP